MGKHFTEDDIKKLLINSKQQLSDKKAKNTVLNICYN